MLRDYNVPAAPVETEMEVKKSRFIARVYRAETREQAMAWLDVARKDYPDARHHCWAYLLGDPHSPRSVAMSDDGEPGGTAGKPILNVLQHKDVGDIMLIVIRYFGGIKLGAGGLVRAYSASAQQGMDGLETELFIRKQVISVTLDFQHENVIRHWLNQHDAAVIDNTYAQQVTLKCQLAVVDLDEFKAFCEGIGGVCSGLDDCP
ncbi:hypothetical protein OLMES_4972 [Oleiphilus messinensis]|uniref:YigZ family protein n=1 Tax=Oleiphilus messinensis TaxID=141451 RepID=A0A1Y0IFQ6_9GAMM|nr:YigZ family protein [Oleiphilus messinensis]ARU58959.1 hypothetical protein OLMES_4972 [Oleiphilus messinensis]